MFPNFIADTMIGSDSKIFCIKAHRNHNFTDIVYKFKRIMGQTDLSGLF